MKNILLIDAELTWLASGREALLVKGHNVITLPKAGLLTEYLRHQIPDLIVLNAGHTPTDVKRVCGMLKNSDDYRDIPVMLMWDKELLSEELRSYEICEILPRPFSISVLLMKVETLLFPGRKDTAYSI